MPGDICCVCQKPIAGAARMLGGRAFCEEHYARVGRNRRGAWVAMVALVIGLAAFMAALDGEVLAALSKSGTQIAWLGAIGEETGNLGAEEAVAAGLRADECVVLEPTDLRIVHAHKGACWFTVATRGRAAHASALRRTNSPWTGGL